MYSPTAHQNQLNPATCLEDIVEAIIDSIRSPIESKDEAERSNELRLRDSSLISMALTSRRACRLYSQSLQHVNLFPRDLYYLRELLRRKPDTGSNFKSFTIRQDPCYRVNHDGVGILIPIFQCLENVETIVIEDPKWRFPFVYRPNFGFKEVPMNFLTHSLKRLKIDLGDRKEDHIRAKQAIWLLVFCTQLKQVSLGFAVFTSDIKFLHEYHHVWKGLSKVEEHALKPAFYERGFLGEEIKPNKFGLTDTVRLVAMQNFLQVTNSLISFELNIFNYVDASVISMDFLSSLHASFCTLKQLRLVDIERQDTLRLRFGAECSMFKNLTCLSIAGQTIISMFTNLDVPESLEKLELPFYDFVDGSMEVELGEEKFLAHLLARPIPNLREVILPATPYNSKLELLKKEESLRKWREDRERLASVDIFLNGKVKMVLSERGERRGFTGVSGYKHLYSFQD